MCGVTDVIFPYASEIYSFMLHRGMNSCYSQSHQHYYHHPCMDVVAWGWINSTIWSSDNQVQMNLNCVAYRFIIWLFLGTKCLLNFFFCCLYIPTSSILWLHLKYFIYFTFFSWKFIQQAMAMRKSFWVFSLSISRIFAALWRQTKRWLFLINFLFKEFHFIRQNIL